MNYEVLVVDDNRQAAAEFARLISVKAKLRAIATDDPEEAIELTKSNPIKVAVLDQRMPKKDGTTLFPEILEVDPLIKGIMLTGEADGQEVGEAMNVGFIDYIHKSEVVNITPRVLLHYCSYHTDIAETDESPADVVFFYRKGPFWLGRHSIEFRLVSAESLSEEWVPPDSWRMIVKVEAGERTKRTVSRQDVSRFVLESEEKAKLAASVNAKIPLVDGLTTELESAVERRFSGTITTEETYTEAVEREFKLPDEPDDPNTLHVKSRQYEHAPVYRQVRITLRKSCTFCNANEVLALTVLHLTGRIATRQIDYMSDGTQRTTDTGIHQQ